MAFGRSARRFLKSSARDIRDKLLPERVFTGTVPSYDGFAEAPALGFGASLHSIDKKIEGLRHNKTRVLPGNEKLPSGFDTSGDAYRSAMRELLLGTKFRDASPAYTKSPLFTSDISEEVHRRVDRFRDCLAPWINRVFPLKNAVVAEIGSGTGSSTLAFAPFVKRIHCFEIEPSTTAIAKKRLSLAGVENVVFEDGLFDANSPFVNAPTQVDIILLIAVLEHLHFDEFKEILRVAFGKLRPGGVILIGETPNRLSFNDYHSSWTPFSQWLPPEVVSEYYKYSPRVNYLEDFGNMATVHGERSPAFHERIVRWGRGVSFHDFELALGPQVHNMIVLDGWEDEVRPLAPIFKDDEVLVDIFSNLKLNCHRAFARSWLYLAIRKP